MKTNSSHKRNAKQRLEKDKPLFSRSKLSRVNRRVTSYEINFTRRLKVQIKLRKFRTSSEKRSKAINQTIFWFGIFGYKEIAIIYKHRKTINHRLKKSSLIISNLSNTVMFAGFVGMVIFGTMMAGFGHTNPPLVEAQAISDNTPEVIELPEPESIKYLLSSTPTKIEIPTIGVNADIQKVGLLKNGSIETPNVLSGLVGWYHYGPTPGELGPAVLVGHVDSYKGPSVFWNLSKLRLGDVINVAREDGTNLEFSVTRIVQYEQDDFKTDEVYGDIDYAGLRVITCGGTFNHVTGHYSKNTVVFAEMVL